MPFASKVFDILYLKIKITCLRFQKKTLKIMDKLEFPLEIKVIIFEYLSVEDLKSASLVCRDWRKVLENKLFWKKSSIIVGHRNYEEVVHSRRFHVMENMTLHPFSLQKHIQKLNYLQQMDFESFQSLTQHVVSLDLRPVKLSVSELILVFGAINSGSSIRRLFISTLSNHNSSLLPSWDRRKFSPSCQNLSQVPPEVLSKAVVKLTEVHLYETCLTNSHIVAVMKEITENKDSRLEQLDIEANDVHEVPTELLGEAVLQLRSVHLYKCDYTMEQIDFIFGRLSQQAPQLRRCKHLTLTTKAKLSSMMALRLDLLKGPKMFRAVKGFLAFHGVRDENIWTSHRN